MQVGALQRLVGGRDDDEVLAQDLLGDERGVVALQRHDDQRQVELPPRQRPDQVTRAALLDQQLDAGVRAVEAGQRVGHQPGAERGRRAQAYPAPAQPRELRHLLPGGVGVGEDAAGQRQQRLASGGQRDVAARPREQPGAEILLQRLDLLAQRRLRDPHALGRLREVTGLRDRHEVRELLKLHVIFLASARAGNFEKAAPTHIIAASYRNQTHDDLDGSLLDT
ncbi:hypothetical protein GCM10020001_032040 [Nonomuraea salmonea]